MYNTQYVCNVYVCVLCYECLCVAVMAICYIVRAHVLFALHVYSLLSTFVVLMVCLLLCLACVYIYIYIYQYIYIYIYICFLVLASCCILFRARKILRFVVLGAIFGYRISGIGFWF